MVFLWIWAKMQAKKLKPKTLFDSEHKILQVFEHIPHEFMRRAVADVEKRLRMRIKNTGSNFEIHLRVAYSFYIMA